MNWNSFIPTLRNARSAVTVRVGDMSWRGAWEHDGNGLFTVSDSPNRFGAGTRTTADFILSADLGTGFYGVAVRVEGRDKNRRLSLSVCPPTGYALRTE